MAISGIGGLAPQTGSAATQTESTSPRKDDQRVGQIGTDQKVETRKAVKRQQVAGAVENSDTSTTDTSTRKPKVSNDIGRALTERTLDKNSGKTADAEVAKRTTAPEQKKVKAAPAATPQKTERQSAPAQAAPEAKPALGTTAQPAAAAQTTATSRDGAEKSDPVKF